MTETTSVPIETAESVDDFAARARTWLAENMPRIDPANPPEADRGEEAPWQRARELQKVGSSRVDLQACKLEYSIVSPK